MSLSVGHRVYSPLRTASLVPAVIGLAAMLAPSTAHAADFHEVITVALGSEGVTAAALYWEQLAAHYGIRTDGQMPTDPTVGYGDDEWNVYFSETGTGKHVPRAIFLDLQPTAVDMIRTGTYRQLYHPEVLISGSYAGAMDPVTGEYTWLSPSLFTYTEGVAYSSSSGLSDLGLDRIRKLSDNTTSLAGFRVITSAEEGAGSGVGAVMLQGMAGDYPSLPVHTYTLLPSRTTIDGGAIPTYNTVFALEAIEQSAASRSYVFGADTLQTDATAALVSGLMSDSPYGFSDNVVDGLTFVGKLPTGSSFEDYTDYLFGAFGAYYVAGNSISDFTDLPWSRLYDDGSGDALGTYPGIAVGEFCSAMTYYGFAGSECQDSDGDGTPDTYDVCPTDPNNVDADGDLVCDASDLCLGDNSTGDADGDQICGNLDLCYGSDATGDTEPDGYCNDVDVCPTIADDQTDTDGDGRGNACDKDDDNDGLSDGADNCPVDYNVDQANTDGDKQGDACDTDDDNDTVLDMSDNCPLVGNLSQDNFDGDSVGDACDTDDDADAVLDSADVCPSTPLSLLVNSRGCSGVQYVSLTCSSTATWKNHGAYVSCVSSAATMAKSSGLLTKDQSGVVVSTAAKSTVGK